MGSQPGFEVAALDDWIGDRLPGHGHPLQATRMGEGTGDLVGTALWLASRASEWVTGVMVRVDGGNYRQTS